MTELTFEYWNKLASQTITISSLLGGFTIAVIANFLVSETKTRLKNNIGSINFSCQFFSYYSVFDDKTSDDDNRWLSE